MLRGRIGGSDEDDSDPAPDDASSPPDFISQRLLQFGLPEELVELKQEGLARYVKDHPDELPKVASWILPDAKLLSSQNEDFQRWQDRCHEALSWLQFSAFGKDPKVALEEVKQQLGGERGVCGSVWGVNDIAYRCHTCEHDPTCAICVPCFQAGDHRSHDYAMIRTSGGCCDCGDATAWKETGFCSRHRGPGQVPPLDSRLVNLLKPVLEVVLVEWRDKLSEALRESTGKSRKWLEMAPEERLAASLSMGVVGMLLEFCNCSESMLSFTAENVSRDDIGLLDTILMAEHILPKNNVNTKLHELLYKLLGDPGFKYRFAQTFIKRYPKFLHDSLAEITPRQRDQSILGSFSVQIFTVPTLTPRLVFEWKLLDMLFSVLKQFFSSCVAEDGRFLVSRPAIQERVYVRAVEDVKYVLSHLKVAQYIIHDSPELCRMWLQFLAHVQGMYPQKRITSIHIEEENEDWVSAFLLEAEMANIHPLFVAGTSLAAEKDNWEDETKPLPFTSAATGKQPELFFSPGDEEASSCIITGARLSKSLVWMISECVVILDAWFTGDQARELTRNSKPAQQPRKKFLVRGRTSRLIIRERQAPEGGNTVRDWLRRSRGSPFSEADAPDEAVEMETDAELGDPGNELVMSSEEAGGTATGKEWVRFEFDVGKQEVSFHIPLHRMLALLLHKALEEYEGKKSGEFSSSSSCSSSSSFLLQLFPEVFQTPALPALLMEHPLRLQVLCAQVQAGMWRRNGHTIVALCDIYRSVQWCEDSLELDIFVLQCCASMAPPEDFVSTVLSCFGLADYFSLFLWKPNEYEPVLAHELLVILIRIISERGFCGLSSKASLRRELVQRLAIGDASHSSLLNALPPRLKDSPDLQEVLEGIANYRRPHGMQQGKYLLREQSWRELDLYHPRWTPRELQSAEERYLRVCKASALFSQPPNWSQPFSPLNPLSAIAVSSKLHEVLRALFFHAAISTKPSDSRAPESLLFTALHLLHLALDVASKCFSREQASSSSSSSSSSSRPPLLAQAPEFVSVGGSDGTQLPEKQSTISLLVLLMRKYVASEGAQLMTSEAAQFNVGAFIRKLLHRFAELDRQCMYAIEAVAPEILHRISADSSSSSSSAASAAAASGSDVKKQDEMQAEISDIERKRALARERQAAMMAKMRAAQDKFLASVETTENEPRRSKSEKSEKSELSRVEGKRPREASGDGDVNETVCALCRDKSTSSPLCILTLVQRSRLLALAQKPIPSWDKVLRDVDETSSFDEENSSVQSLVRREAENLISELRQWLEGAVGDPNVDRLTNRDDFFELLRGELPTIFNTERLAQTPATSGIEASSHSDSTTAADAPFEEIDSFQDAPEGSFPEETSWWEQGASSSSSGGASRGGGAENSHAVIAVLAEYVATVSRPPAPSNAQIEGGETTAGAGAATTPRETRENSISSARARRSRNNAIESKVYNSIGVNDFIGLHISACGHAAHHECVERYYSSLLQRYYSRSLFEGVQIVDPDLGEFLCPVCRRLSNSVLPMLQPGPRTPPSEEQQTNIFRLDQAFQLLHNGEELISKPGFRKSSLRRIPDSLKPVMDSVSKRLSGLFFPDRDNNNNNNPSSNSDQRNFQGLYLWDLLRYSIMAAELAARTKSLISGHQDAASRLVALEESAEAARGSTLPVLFLAGSLASTHNRQSVLLRARGLQLMVGAICHGISRDLPADKNTKSHLHNLLSCLETGQHSADVQFWRRAADPVLVHDPFSSLVWLLFVLPLPLPASQPPFMALVHVFYLVCLIQCLASIGRVPEGVYTPGVQSFLELISSSLQLTCLSSRPSQLPDLPGVSSRAPPEELGTSISLQPDDLRRLTLPYLRRCGLLQTVCSSPPGPISGSNNWELSNVYSQVSGLAHREMNAPQGGGDEALELGEVEELEKRFGIPGLERILSDEGVQRLVRRWCDHLRGESTYRFFSIVPRPVRAVAFQLMRLPHLFQDLLQRFIKERCPRCKNVPDRPALCLLCGALCCGSGPNGCCSAHMQSECYRHAVACGGGVGVYILLRRTNVFLLRRERHAIWPSPYLDAFGEEDQDMRRGKPLYLSEERYAALTAMVASHSLDYSSSVLSNATRDLF